MLDFISKIIELDSWIDENPARIYYISDNETDASFKVKMVEDASRRTGFGCYLG